MARPVHERGRMQIEKEEIIQKYTEDIERDLDAKDLTAHLFARFIIDKHDKDDIESGRIAIERTRRLLSILIVRGSNAFNGFLDSLEAAGYKILASKLKSQVGPTDGLKTWINGQYLTQKVDNLDTRIHKLEKEEVTRDKVNSLSYKVDAVVGDINDIKMILRRVEELSTASKETENTINQLNEKLREREQMLAEARKKIEDLENKVESLERKNLGLKQELKLQNKRVESLEAKTLKQEKGIDDLKVKADYDRNIQQKARKEAEKDRQKHAQLLQDQEIKRLEFEAEQERKMREFQDDISKQIVKSTQPSVLPQSGPKLPYMGAMAINKMEPRNRFQPDRKYKH